MNLSQELISLKVYSILYHDGRQQGEEVNFWNFLSKFISTLSKVHQNILRCVREYDEIKNNSNYPYNSITDRTDELKSIQK